MNKKIQFLLVALAIFVSTSVKADPIINSTLDLLNPDVRKCLLQSCKADGWELKAVYLNSSEKLVYIFSKDGQDLKYINK